MTARTSTILAVGAALLVGFGAGVAVGHRYPPEPRNREECYLRNLRPGLSERASAIVAHACRERFPQ